MIPPDFDAHLLARFGRSTLSRARNLVTAGRAVTQKVVRRGNTWLIEGRCRGGQFFDVNLRLNTCDGDRLIEFASECTCIEEIDCEHGLALLLATLESDLRPLAAAIPDAAPGAMAPDPRAKAWLDALDGSLAPVASAQSSSYCVVYLLHATNPPRLAVGKSRLLKRGGLGKPAVYRPQSYDLPEPGDTSRDFFAETDIVPLRLYLTLASAGSYNLQDNVALDGELGKLLVNKALATGRLFAVIPGREADMAMPLRWGEALPLAMKWVFDSSGRQRLLLDLPTDLVALACWPMLALDPAAGRLLEMRSALPEPTLAALLQAPPLNELDAPLARRRLERLASENSIALPLPDVPAVGDAGEPRPRLILSQGRFRHQLLTGIVDAHALAELVFDYPCGATVVGDELPPPVLRHRDADGQWRTLARQVAAEETVWRVVQDLGLAPFTRRLPGHLRVDKPGIDCLLPAQQSAAGWLPLLGAGQAALDDAGIALEIEEAFPYCLADADEWFVELEAESTSDWFDLDLGVVVGGERLSLVPPLLKLLRDDPQLPMKLRGLADDVPFPLALDERRLLPVPAGRLKAWLLPLLEFLDDERPRLSRHHAAALAGLDDSATQWIGGEELRALGKRLSDFSGLAVCPPAPGFTATLRAYQQAGLDWLQFLREFGLAGILADDMGLGKTVQTLAHLHLEKASGRADRPSLVIAPTSLVANWRNEAAQFAPELKVLTLHGSERAARFGEIAGADLIVTTYPLLLRDREILLGHDYHLLVLDEAQFIKNPKAQSHQVARQLRARHRLSLTGTPLENHLGELWAQFDFLMPGFLGNAARFARVFRTPIEKQQDFDARTLLAARVRPFLLRRTKDLVLKELPPRTEMTRWIALDGEQRDLYESLRVAFDKRLRQVLAEQGVGRSQIMILDALLKLRQVCCDPRLVKLPAAEKIGRQGVQASAKLGMLLELIDELLSEGRRILLFSQFTSMLALIETELDARGIAYAELTGQTRDRETPIREFQEGRVPLFLISLKAGGTGLNLTAADTVIHYDPWWNPAVEEQATARAHRIGQDKPVFVYKLLTEGTVEEKILALQGRKRGLADQLIKGGGDEGSGHLLSAADLEVLFQPLPSG